MLRFFSVILSDIFGHEKPYMASVQWRVQIVLIHFVAASMEGLTLVA